jgi:hypothetical protein
MATDMISPGSEDGLVYLIFRYTADGFKLGQGAGRRDIQFHIVEA